ncbi:MAG: exopolyphosphatase [Acidimicrobiales bacterium]
MPEAATGTHPVAAVDCGTNSTRLLIAAADGASLDRRMRITRLGEGVDRTGELQPAAVDRTLEVLRDYAEAIAVAGVRRRLAVATSAIRDAANASTFLLPAAEVLGTELRVLAGDEEGRLSYGGATAELPKGGERYIVVDVGGGSTELVTSSGGNSVEAVSLDVGCVRVTERFLRSDPPAPGELSEARSYVTSLVDAARGEHPGFAAATGLNGSGGTALVGLAGTVSALTMLNLELGAYDRAAVHHACLTRADVSRLLAELAAVDVVARRERRGMERDRADVIVGGAVVLLAVMDVLCFSELIVSESDILDGIVADLRPS